MNLAELGLGNPRSVVVLGAGASRGATFANQARVSPPLDSDFFEQVRRMPEGSLTAADRDLLSYLGEEYGVGQDPTLETLFTQVSAIDRFHHDFNIRGRVIKKYERYLETLRQLIPRVFGVAFSAGNASCRWHDRLAATLRTEDAILSFNYDCLIDGALARMAGKRWRASTGYGFPVRNGAADWEERTTQGRPYAKPIRLLKPHGSLNWAIDRDNDAVDLVGPYQPTTHASVVPPTWDKSEVTQDPWLSVWRESRQVLAQARALIVVGYSVPATDQLSQALFRADVRSLDALVLVNPDDSARSRFRSLVASAFNKDTRVIEYPSLSHFAQELEPTAAEDLPGIQRRFQVDQMVHRVSADLGRAISGMDVSDPSGFRLVSQIEQALQPLRDILRGSDKV